jgi:hypothetical protein
MGRCEDICSVMPGLVPGIHVLLFIVHQDVDGRDKPGHDGGVRYRLNTPAAPGRR